MGMRMHKPPHPGETIRELCLKPLGLSVTDPESWLSMQMEYDLWIAEKKRSKLKVKRIKVA